MNGEINWGPEIRVDGVRPEWLTQADVRVAMIDCGYGERPVNRDADPIQEWGWLGIRTLRLPADHHHYIGVQVETVDWGSEIVAVHDASGEVYSAFWQQAHDGRKVFVHGKTIHFRGSSTTADGWTIRNVVTPPADARTAPKGGEVGPEVVERLVQHIRGMAAQYDAGNQGIDYAYAKDLVALLPEPVDGDLIAAREAVCGMSDVINKTWIAECMAGCRDADIRVRSALAALRYRALEKEAGR